MFAVMDANYTFIHMFLKDNPQRDIGFSWPNMIHRQVTPRLGGDYSELILTRLVLDALCHKNNENYFENFEISFLYGGNW